MDKHFMTCQKTIIDLERCLYNRFHVTWGYYLGSNHFSCTLSWIVEWSVSYTN